MTDNPSPNHDALKQILGQHLSGVSFVRDCLLLQFNPPTTIKLYTPATVFSHGEFVRSGDDQFRNRLGQQVTKIVESVGIVPGDALKIRFEDASVIVASVRQTE